MAGEFSDADLAVELAELTRAANRANVTIYTIDPRGLVGPLSDLDQEVDPQQWQEFVRKSQDSLRVLADETGGIAVVNQNDFDKALKRIDAETSDYYVLGYYSSNPDPTKRRRKIEVRVTRANISVQSRKEYVLKTVPMPPPVPAPVAREIVAGFRFRLQSLGRLQTRLPIAEIGLAHASGATSGKLATRRRRASVRRPPSGTPRRYPRR